jgi:hypothetical protein
MQSARDIQVLDFKHRGRGFELRIMLGRSIGLVYNGVLRKERMYNNREPLYVWTNVELEWEEHHYIEARYWPSSGVIEATVNGAPLRRWVLEKRSPREFTTPAGPQAI